MISLPVLREQNEHQRFERQRHDDSRTAVLAPDAAALAAELRRTTRGEVRFDPGSRALYATDGSNYRQVPIGVVIPHDAEDVVQTVAACRRHGAPVLGRAAAPAWPASAATSPSSWTSPSACTTYSASTRGAGWGRSSPAACWTTCAARP
jgi:hypothetical protein